MHRCCASPFALAVVFLLGNTSLYLNNFERQNKGFYGLFGDYGLRDTFQERIAPKPIEIEKDKLRMKFLVLNIDFDSPSLDFLRAIAGTAIALLSCHNSVCPSHGWISQKWCKL